MSVGNRPVLQGRYELVDRIASGGMGVVYRAHDRMLERTVAVKLLRADLSGSPDMVARFRREARAAAALHHPNVVDVLDYGQDRGHWFLVMEFVDGETLAELLERVSLLPVDQSLAIARQVAAALAAAHDRGLVHRDIKPANILVDGRANGGRTRVRVADFGLARVLHGAQLTRTGAVMGTPQYVAPEQAQGHPSGPPADVYAFGVTMFEMFTGGPPFNGDTPGAVAVQHVVAPVPDPRGLVPSLPAPLAELVMRSLAKEPSTRFADGRALARALAAIRPDASGVPAARHGSRDTLELPAEAVATAVAAGALLSRADSEPPAPQDVSAPSGPPPGSGTAAPEPPRLRGLLLAGGLGAAAAALVVAAVLTMGVIRPDVAGSAAVPVAVPSPVPTSAAGPFPAVQSSPVRSAVTTTTATTGVPLGVVPEGLVGVPSDQARTMLQAAGYDSVMTDVDSGAFPSGHVVSVTPSEGAELPRGRAVLLGVAASVPAATSTDPDDDTDPADDGTATSSTTSTTLPSGGPPFVPPGQGGVPPGQQRR